MRSHRFILATSLSSLAALAHAQDIRLNKAVPPGHEIVLFGHARWDDDCAMKEIGEFRLDKAPTRGVVCTRIADIRVSHVYRGTAKHCLGHVVRGVQIVYVAKDRAVGKDMVDYTVKYSTSSPSVGVSIDVRADHPTARGAVPRDIAAPPGGYVQPLGRIPPCSALVS
jgi:hypothetical protein